MHFGWSTCSQASYTLFRSFTSCKNWGKAWKRNRPKTRNLLQLCTLNFFFSECGIWRTFTTQCATVQLGCNVGISPLIGWALIAPAVISKERLVWHCQNPFDLTTPSTASLLKKVASQVHRPCIFHVFLPSFSYLPLGLLPRQRIFCCHTHVATW